MTIQARRLLRIELTVTDLTRLEQFYVGALGFTSDGRSDAEPAMAAMLGAGQVRQTVLRRGGQILFLQAFEPEGAPYPEHSAACDQVFQHFAMPVPDMARAVAGLDPFAPTPISSAGPQQLPPRSGGATAYKFRDPDGHPLELIQFAGGGGGGIDHSAIAVADAERSIRFYRDQLGLQVQARQLNTGVEQDRLDGLSDVNVEVIALLPEQEAPHVELLAYRTPPGSPMHPARPRDTAATRMVLEVTGLPEPATVLADGSRALLTRDPDGHALVLIERKAG